MEADGFWEVVALLECLEFSNVLIHEVMAQSVQHRFEIVLFLLVCFSTLLNAKQFHVTVNGLASGSGTLENPWSLSKGLSASTLVKPGDTLMIHGGIYKGNFTSSLVGEQDRYVVVMN